MNKNRFFAMQCAEDYISWTEDGIDLTLEQYDPSWHKPDCIIVEALKEWKSKYASLE